MKSEGNLTYFFNYCQITYVRLCIVHAKKKKKAQTKILSSTIPLKKKKKRGLT